MNGYTNLTSVFLPGALRMGWGGICVVGHDLLIRGEYPKERLALRYLLPRPCFSQHWRSPALGTSSKGAPELPCLD